MHKSTLKSNFYVSISQTPIFSSLSISMIVKEMLMFFNVEIKIILFFFIILLFPIAAASSQLIVHSSKVHTPQRHNSESVLYMNEESISSANAAEDSSLNSQQRSSRSDNRLFPISTYVECSAAQNNSLSSPSLPSPENK